VVMIGIAIVGLFLFASPAPTKVPVLDTIISNRSKTIYILHKGGDALFQGQYRILVDGGDQTANFTIIGTGTEPWSVGETLSAIAPVMPKRVVLIFNQTGTGGNAGVLGARDLFGMVNVPQPQNQTNWYFNAATGVCNWGYRKQITLSGSQVTAPLSSFPVLISDPSDPDLSGHALASGNDILFTDSSGTALLPFEIENYTTGSGTLVAWVQVPTLPSGTDTVLYMYYGNTSSTGQQNPSGVWDAGYMAVWHLKEVGSTGANAYNDSTSNANNGRGGGGAAQVPVQSAGEIGYGQNFVPNDCISTNYVQSAVTAYTIEAWAKTTTATKQSVLVHDRGSGAGKSLTLSIGGTYPSAAGAAGDVAYGVDSNSIYIGNYTTQTVNDNVWHHLAGVWNATSGSAVTTAQFRIYIDGVLAPSTGVTTGSTTSPLTGLGGTQIANHTPWGTFYSGYLDEVRISTTVRSPDWIRTEYNNQASPSSFASIGAEERYWKC